MKKSATQLPIPHSLTSNYHSAYTNIADISTLVHVYIIKLLIIIIK